MLSSFRRNSVLSYHRLPASGLTLIEILIALTMTLIVLGAMMTAFQFASEKMQYGRAMMELSNRARAAESLLRSDLENITVDVRPYAQTSDPPGFFEYVEGPNNDNTHPTANPNLYSYLGDFDDAMGMTVRSPARPFRGRLVNAAGAITTLESTLAEVWWYTTWNDLDGDATTVQLDETIRIHRRVLLIRPDLNNASPAVLPSGVTLAAANTFLSNNDVSCRVVQVTTGPATYDVIANNLADLALRHNRFAHNLGAFPNNWSQALAITRGSSNGTDILLTDAAAFDIRAYSPNANVNLPDADGDTVVDPGDTGVNIIAEPGDPGYVDTTGAGTVVGDLGAYVDLAYDINATGGAFNDDAWFSGAAQTNGYAFSTAVFDTWTPSYESDGINQDGDAATDEGTDGFDTDNANGVDDTGERETYPPYPYPIRGLKVTIRLIEDSTKQVQQTSVIQSFVPE